MSGDLLKQIGFLPIAREELNQILSLTHNGQVATVREFMEQNAPGHVLAEFGIEPQEALHKKNYGYGYGYG